MDGSKLRRTVFALGMIVSGPVWAGWIQSLGQSERCIALGGACVAIADDFAAFYHNPAAAADFRRPVLGGNLRILDLRHGDLEDSAGNHDTPKSNRKGTVVLAPSIGGYYPVSDRVTVGLGFGTPFAITADWTNNDGIHRFNMSEQALLLLDLTPTVAFKVNENLSLGAGLNIVALKHLRTETLIPNSFGAALPPALGGLGIIIPTTPTSPTIGSVTIHTKDDVRLGIPPDDFSTAFDEFALTLGGLYKVNDRLSLGAVYRSKTKSTWKGDVTLDLTPAGGARQTVPFNLDLDMPGHFQVGFAYQVVPDKLTWSLDWQRTFWSRTKGLGSPSDIRLGSPLLGFINNIRLDYAARDTNIFRTGIQYRIRPDVTLLFGYAYDQKIFDDTRVDILTYDSDRHIFSFGVNWDRRTGQERRGWTYNAGLQVAHYERRTIATGQSANLGGLSLPNLVSPDTLGFVPNRDMFTFGGNIFAIGGSIQYAF